MSRLERVFHHCYLTQEEHNFSPCLISFICFVSRIIGVVRLFGKMPGYQDGKKQKMQYKLAGKYSESEKYFHKRLLKGLFL